MFIFVFSTVPPAFPAQTLPTNKQTRNEDESVSYSCTSEAKPAAKFLWTLNGKSLANIPPYSISSQILPIPGSKLLRTIGYIVIDKLTWKQAGKFSCIAMNDAGRAIQSTELEVPCKYQCTRQYIYKEQLLTDINLLVIAKRKRFTYSTKKFSYFKWLSP